MKRLHIEHPEDTILTGDLSVLDAFTADNHYSVKIDGSPAIVWELTQRMESSLSAPSPYLIRRSNALITQSQTLKGITLTLSCSQS